MPNHWYFYELQGHQFNKSRLHCSQDKSDVTAKYLMGDVASQNQRRIRKPSYIWLYFSAMQK